MYLLSHTEITAQRYLWLNRRAVVKGIQITSPSFICILKAKFTPTIFLLRTRKYESISIIRVQKFPSLTSYFYRYNTLKQKTEALPGMSFVSRVQIAYVWDQIAYVWLIFITDFKGAVLQV